MSSSVVRVSVGSAVPARPARPAARSRDLASVARGGSIASIGAAVAAVGGLLLTVVVGRGLGAQGAGLFFEAVAIFMIASSLCTLGADTGLMRALSRTRPLGRIREIPITIGVALVPVALVGVIVTFALQALTPTVVDVVSHGRGTATTQLYFHLLLAFLVVGSVATVLAQSTRALGGVLPFVLVQNVLLPIGRPVVIGVAVLAGWSSLSVPLLWAGLFVPALLVSGTTLARQVRYNLNRIDLRSTPPRPIRQIAVEFWRFAAVRGLANAIDLSLIWFDVLLVGSIRSTAEAGVYATASRFITTGTLVMQAMRLAIAPQISALMSTGQVGRAAQIYRTATLWIIASSWPLYLGLAAFGPLLLRLFGKDFTSGGTALSILSLAMLINLGTGNVGTVLLMVGKSSWMLMNKSAAIVTNVSLNLLLVPGHGINGAAIAWAAAIAVDNLAAVAEVRWGLGMQGYGRASALVAAASLICFGGGAIVARHSLGHGVDSLLWYLASTIPIYLAALWHWRDLLHLSQLHPALAKKPLRPTLIRHRKVG